jgi:uncharacterized protein
MSENAASVSVGRLTSLDALRGLAVLGMLIVNIQSFAMIDAAYINPMAYGDLEGMNRVVWIWTHLLADMKFITIFSLLFGAGVLIFAQNLDRKGIRPSKPFYRRMLALLILGLIHAYLFWHGDILVCYALCGSLVFLMRKASTRSLLAFGLILVGIPAFNYWLFGMSLPSWPAAAVDGLRDSWQPGAEKIAGEIAALRGGLGEQMGWRIPAAISMQTFLFAILFFWRTLGMMMVGMALYKSGMLRNAWPGWSYALLMFGGLALGLPLIWQGVQNNFDAGWSVEYSMFLGWQYNYAGSLLVAMAYCALILGLAKWRPGAMPIRLLSPVGRMALTNYILMTLVCGVVFYGHGFSLFGRVERSMQVVIVFFIWFAVVLFSHIWLKYRAQGPLEHLWRHFTYHGIGRPA